MQRGMHIWCTSHQALGPLDHNNIRGQYVFHSLLTSATIIGTLLLIIYRYYFKDALS